MVKIFLPAPGRYIAVADILPPDGLCRRRSETSYAVVSPRYCAQSYCRSSSPTRHCREHHAFLDLMIPAECHAHRLHADVSRERLPPRAPFASAVYHGEMTPLSPAEFLTSSPPPYSSATIFHALHQRRQPPIFHRPEFSPDAPACFEPIFAATSTWLAIAAAS